MTPPSDLPLASVGTNSNWSQLPVVAYRALERWHPGRINALAVYCSDGRWGAAFDEFCHRHLRIPRYDRWAVPGGPVPGSRALGIGIPGARAFPLRPGARLGRVDLPFTAAHPFQESETRGGE